MMHSKTVEIWVGLFVALGLGALLVLSMKVSNLAGVYESDSYQVKAYFSNIGGLKVKSPVKMAGVVVGRIADIQFDNERYQAVVTLRIDAKYKQLPNDTSASIYTAGLLGEQYIGLEAGGDDLMLQDGDSITLTQSAVVLEQLIGQFLYQSAAEGTKK